MKKNEKNIIIINSDLLFFGSPGAGGGPFIFRRPAVLLIQSLGRLLKWGGMLKKTPS